MRIRMLKTESGSVDGIRVRSYEKDSDYVLASTDGELSLAAAFVGAGLAVDLGGASGSTAVKAEPSAPIDPELENRAAAIEPAFAPPAAKPGRAKKQ